MQLEKDLLSSDSDDGIKEFEIPEENLHIHLANWQSTSRHSELPTLTTILPAMPNSV